MSQKNLSLLRKVAEMTCSCSLFVVIGGEKFAIGSSGEWVEILHVPSRDSVEAETVAEMAEFMRSHSPYQLSLDNDLYIQVIREAILVALSPSVGVDKLSMETLIGSFAESRPEECESLLKYVKGI